MKVRSQRGIPAPTRSIHVVDCVPIVLTPCRTSRRRASFSEKFSVAVRERRQGARLRQWSVCTYVNAGFQPAKLAVFQPVEYENQSRPS
jgi:hypothetical protein